MIGIQKEFSGLLSEVISITKECKIENGKAEALKDAVDNMHLPVAIVGEFSAGKSTMLNNFIGKKLLATNIKPETAIASELYYSEIEYAEGVKGDGTVVRLSDTDTVGADFKCIRRYINSENLKAIQPLVLVDMPGFDSPLDSHSKAILSYLSEAVHYIVLTPADSGTITSSMKRQLENIVEFKKDLTFFVSKTDLRSDEEANAVVQHMESEIENILGVQKKVGKINQEETKVFSDMVKTLDPAALFKNAFMDSMKDVFYETRMSINTRLAALKNDEKKNKIAIQELEAARDRLKERKEKLIAEKKQYAYSNEADVISSAVGNTINSNMDSLVAIAMGGGADALTEEINSIIQNTVIEKVNKVIENVSMNFSTSFGNECKELNNLLDSFNSSGFINNLQNKAQNWYNSSREKINLYIQKREEKGGNVAYTSITGVLAATTDIVHPIAEVIIILLPEIINLIFAEIDKQNKQEEIRQKIIGQMPTIKRNIRTKVVEILQQNSEALIQKISEQFDEALKTKTKEIQAAQAELEKNTNIPEQIAQLESNYKKLEALEKKLLSY
ncbi:dynamin family protein [Treponema phagedenis]|uniref:GTP-binding domain protein n=1 Tax=Treponema phagedenis TaxID=162 RepID=A0A0B7GW59_TREPH|nr:dynamin family protein [Treponema phagedenis]NVP22871.1 dynamin family protein [Treponema phagedenis]QEJ94946.1 hypothetical protein FUT79_06795 [Treponema phagedenis]QEJ98327.1 hypothetical protein FUT82_10175 [Treponema phagedenis]QEK00847.1 hypothetical protein FUT84_06455 [Treponema phagedenis]QEK03837.1 hypothetical protein FUT83_08485 [Treponema phagedenis]